MLDTKQKEVIQSGMLFPGRWFGGTALLLGPLLLFIGVMLRYKFHFFFPDQLEAYQSHPGLMTASYSIFAAGITVMFPAIMQLAEMIRVGSPRFAFWGMTFAFFGLIARIFHAGVDHLAFQIVREDNALIATQIIADTYGAFHIFKTFTLPIMVGWIILAIGAYRAKTLKLIPCISLALMSSLPLGVLKGSTMFSVIATAGLCVALVPLGLKVLLDGPKPSAIKLLGCSLGTILIISLFYFVGQAG